MTRFLIQHRPVLYVCVLEPSLPIPVAIILNMNKIRVDVLSKSEGSLAQFEGDLRSKTHISPPEKPGFEGGEPRSIALLHCYAL